MPLSNTEVYFVAWQGWYSAFAWTKTEPWRHGFCSSRTGRNGEQLQDRPYESPWSESALITTSTSVTVARDALCSDDIWPHSMLRVWKSEYPVMVSLRVWIRDGTVFALYYTWWINWLNWISRWHTNSFPLIPLIKQMRSSRNRYEEERR